MRSVRSRKSRLCGSASFKLGVMTAGVFALTACVSDLEDEPVEDVGGGQESFEAFERAAFREPDSGIYIVNGDTPVADIKHLREFWETYVRGWRPHRATERRKRCRLVGGPEEEHHLLREHDLRRAATPRS